MRDCTPGNKIRAEYTLRKADNVIHGRAGDGDPKPIRDGQFCFGMLSNSLIRALEAKVLKMKPDGFLADARVWVIVLQ